MCRKDYYPQQYRHNDWAYLSCERWDAYTPAPHPSDKFECDVHEAYWLRITGDYHNCANVKVTYINTSWQERPVYQPLELAQGKVR